jgi:hypothetical protein
MDAQAVSIFTKRLGMRLVVGNVEHDVKIAGIISVPRLGFMDNYYCSIQAFTQHGIPLVKGTGAFWDQTMSRLLTEASKEESENTFVVTMDYDSVFEPECISRLVSAALVSGYDAVAPLQCKRDDQKLMFTPTGMGGQSGEITLPAEWWEKPVQPADSAHFGLTVIRCDALRRMPKPWFLGVPNEDGGWEDLPETKTPRVDPDIYFWRKWKECGNTLAISPQVSIGHCELVITWPDQRLKAIHQYPTHYWNDGGRRPPEAWGSPEHAEKSAAR